MIPRYLIGRRHFHWLTHTHTHSFVRVLNSFDFRLCLLRLHPLAFEVDHIGYTVRHSCWTARSCVVCSVQVNSCISESLRTDKCAFAYRRENAFFLSNFRTNWSPNTNKYSICTNGPTQIVSEYGLRMLSERIASPPIPVCMCTNAYVWGGQGDWQAEKKNSAQSFQCVGWCDHFASNFSVPDPVANGRIFQICSCAALAQCIYQLEMIYFYFHCRIYGKHISRACCFYIFSFSVFLLWFFPLTRSALLDCLSVFVYTVGGLYSSFNVYTSRRTHSKRTCGINKNAIHSTDIQAHTRARVSVQHLGRFSNRIIRNRDHAHTSQRKRLAFRRISHFTFSTIHVPSQPSNWCGQAVEISLSLFPSLSLFAKRCLLSCSALDSLRSEPRTIAPAQRRKQRIKHGENYNSAEPTAKYERVKRPDWFSSRL